jgi:hypothetical protein
MLPNQNVLYTAEKDGWTHAVDVDRIIATLTRLLYVAVDGNHDIPVPPECRERFGHHACRIRITDRGRDLLAEIQATP